MHYGFDPSDITFSAIVHQLYNYHSLPVVINSAGDDEHGNRLRISSWVANNKAFLSMFAF